MSDTELNIRLNAYGGDNAAGDINKAKSALEDIQRTGGGMGETFGKKFSAIGLTNLNYELLHSIEYTGKAKPVIGAMNMMFYSLASSVGASTSALFPYIMAITAVVAIIAKMKPAQTETNKTITEADKINVKVTESYRDAVAGLDAYIKVHGTAPAAFKEYVTALHEVEIAEDNRSKKTLATEIDTLQKAIDIEQKNQTTLQDSIKSNKDLSEVQKIQAERLQTQGPAYLGVVLAQRMNNKELKENQENLKATNDKLEQHKEQLKKAKTELMGLSGGYSKIGKDQEKLANDEKKRLTESIAFVKKTLDSKFNIEMAHNQGAGMMSAVFAKNMQDAWGNAYLGMTKGAGDAFAAMIVDGKAFNKSMEEVFKNILKSFISMVAEMAIRWAAIKFITGGLGLNLPGFMTRATGADEMVDRPTMFMAGENGPERVSVTPMGSGRLGDTGSAKGGDTYQISNTFTISGAGDPQKIADVVAQKIIYSIRGRGQLNFVRGGA